MKAKKTPYEKMLALSHEATLFDSIQGLTGWDQETYMPPGASSARGEQHEALAGHIHKLHTSKKWERALSQLIDLQTGAIVDKTLSDEQQAAAKKWRRDFIHNTALPEKFVKEFAKVTSQAIVAWRKAREESAFHKFAPFLERIVDLNRRKAAYKKYEDNPYDALVDDYEPGMTKKTLGHVFGQIRPKLIALLQHIKSADQVDNSCLKGHFETQKQLQFGREILAAMGYNFDFGRLDLSTHPFSSTIHPHDSRVTTRVHEDYVYSNIAACLHEGGHALYGMGLKVEEYASPLGQAISMGMHESQSRWWETRIGLSAPFWNHFLPKLQAVFPQIKADINTFYRAINKVEPSFIRVEADEVTYPLHIMLRFELETALIDGSLRIRDVPEAWNQKMHELLGITPADAKQGCLQDIHWSMGAFGYFPTYSLGNMYAAQFFEQFEKQHPDWKSKVEKGDLAFIRQWLSDNIYVHGRRYDSEELIQKVTGKPFSSEPYARYLESKYKAIYS